jgi:hypothetical protein
MAMKYAFEVQRADGSWSRLFEESRSYCLGYCECSAAQPGPRLACRVVHILSGSVIAGHPAQNAVSIGQIAGHPSPAQYEAAAERALTIAAKLREREAERGAR